MSEPAPAVAARELVILARDFDGLVEWYASTLGLAEVARFPELPYANLESTAGLRVGIGIAPAEAAAIDPTVIPQIETPDVAALLHRVRERGGSIDGPLTDSARGFSFGSFKDPEGNPWWVVDPNCP